MLSTLISVLALLVSFGILSLGHGLNNTLIGVRATLEHYPEWVTGLMMSGYFIGFFIGTYVAPRMILKIGQIRTFAALASVASSISLLHVLFINEIAWILFRSIYGFCFAGLYVVIESWLNALSNKKNRGRILSVYMIISLSCLALGQVFVFVAEPSEYILFAIVSILISFALVPITISKAKQPEGNSSEAFGFKRLYTISPLATLGCVTTGLTSGAFWGLGAVYFTQIGLDPRDVGIMISSTFIGGLLLQWPIGHLSDVLDRRIVIAGVLVASVVVCMQIIMSIDNGAHVDFKLIALGLLFGGFSYTLYSLFITLANDYLEPQFLVRASGGLLSFHAIGAIFGPAVAALFMTFMGNKGLFVFIGMVNFIIFIIASYRVFTGRKIPESTSEPFVSMPRTGAAFVELDPRGEE